MSSSKKLACKKRDFAAVVYVSAAKNPIIPSPTYCLHVFLLYTVYLFTREGGGGVELNQREGERGNRGEYRSQSWTENTNMTECTQEIGHLQSINSDKHPP
jgi:hypothetical protein